MMSYKAEHSEAYEIVHELCSNAVDRILDSPLTLALLVAGVSADHHNATVPADYLALVADLLDAGLYLHGSCGPLERL